MLKIREYTSPVSGTVAMLIDLKGQPLHFPNRYAYSMYEKRGCSLSTIRQVLYVIGRIYIWAETKNINLRQILYYGDFLTPDEVSDLVDFIYFTSVTQCAILKQKKHLVQISNSKSILSFKNNSGLNYQYSSPKLYSNRLRYLSKYLGWVIVERKAQRIFTSEKVLAQSKLAQSIIANSIPRVRARQDDETLEAVDLAVVRRVSEIAHPNHPENPFKGSFVRHRNYLLLMLLIESGGRREEVYHTKSKDIISSTQQYNIEVSKTTPRTLPVSQNLIFAFEQYFNLHWRNLKGAGRSEGYLFVKSNGERVTLRAVNYVLETLRREVPDVPIWFHNHTLRRTFNHRLSKLIDQKRAEGIEISHEEERKVRNRLNGWVPHSNMGDQYNSRHIREKADLLAETALNILKRPL